MTIDEHIKTKEPGGDLELSEEASIGVFKGILQITIYEGMGGHSCGVLDLPHITTIDQFNQLYLLLSGREFGT